MESFLGIELLNIRIHTDLPIDIIEDWVNTTSPIKYILTQEYATRQHYHLLWKGQLTEATMRARLSKRFGKGNKTISCKNVIHEKHLSSYILKDGQEVCSKGYSPEDIELLRNMSYKKGKSKLMDEIDAALEIYYTQPSSIYSDQQLLSKVITIKSSYGQGIYLNHIRSWFMSKKCKKEGQSYSDYLATKILDLV